MDPVLSALNARRVPRLEDLPYWTSPPIQFVYESTANLAAGNYLWADAPGVMIPNRPIRENVLYYFRSISLVSDTTDFDFSTNVVVTPGFQTFRESDSRTVLFREPVLMNKFYDQFTYRLIWSTHRAEDILYGAFIMGQLVQGAGLIGKLSITLKAIISAQEIVGEQFIDLFKAHYPEPPEDIREVRE